MARERRGLEDPLSEQTQAKRMKLEPNKEIQFGYQYHSQCSDIRITNYGLVAETAGKHSGGLAHSALPLRGRAEFEMKIVKFPCYEIGLRKFKKKNASGCCITPFYDSDYSTCLWCPGKKLYILANKYGYVDLDNRPQYGYVDLDDLREGDRFGLRISEDGVLEFTVNGESQGIAAVNVYTRNSEVFAFVYNWNGSATLIIKTGEIILLRQGCIWGGGGGVGGIRPPCLTFVPPLRYI